MDYTVLRKNWRKVQMRIFKSLIPEIIYSIGVVIIFFSMWDIMGFAYAMFFLGAVAFIVASYLSSVINIQS